MKAVVLVEPQCPANVGAAARAMKNFGLSDLWIVGTRHALPRGDGSSEAHALASSVADVRDGARAFATLEEAVAHLHLVAVTTGREGVAGDVMTLRALAAEAASLPAGSCAGVVFGREDHGLARIAA